jgi:hypothetical protein
LFNQDHAIYLLYSDDTEAMAFETAEILAHDGIMGIERRDWERSPEYASLLAAAQNSDVDRETNLLNGEADFFAIYQLKSGDETRDYRFEGTESLDKRGLTVDRSNYNLVYAAPLLPDETIEQIYHDFNVASPKDFTGHSLSVSDVVVMQRDGEVSSHFIDRFGTTELPAFLGVEKQPEAHAPTVEQPTAVPPSPSAPEITAPMLDIPKSEQPIYRFSADEALRKDEIEAFHQSRNLNVECGRAIDQAIINSNYELHRYDLKSAARAVVEEYGADRVAWIVASYVNNHDYDGRYSSANKSWAAGFDTPKPDFFLQTHPAVLDGFVDRLRAIEKEKPSLMATQKAGERKSKAEFDGKAQPGLEAPEKATKYNTER